MTDDIWENIIKTYDRCVDSGEIAPIAHTRIIAQIGILLDTKSNVLAAAKIHQSIFAPCTAQSECRSRNVSPHLIYDKVSYVADIDNARHSAYMDQLDDYVKNTDHVRSKIILKYLAKNTINADLEYLVDVHDKNNTNLVITFGIKEMPEITVDECWTKYHLSKLPQNGICPITGLQDYIPDAYPGYIRYPGDKAKLFCGKDGDPLSSMPTLKPGYIASQKIIHTLQALYGGWVDQDGLSINDCVFRSKKITV